MGFIKDIKFQVDKLWTYSGYDDFRLIEDIPEGTRIDDTNLDTTQPRYFPSPHIQISYNPSVYQFSAIEIGELFTQLAPAHLVLHQITGKVVLQSGTSVSYTHLTLPTICSV